MQWEMGKLAKLEQRNLCCLNRTESLHESENKHLQAACFLGKTMELLVAHKWILSLAALRTHMLPEPKPTSVESKWF